VVLAAEGSPKAAQYLALAQVPSVRQRRQAKNCSPCHPILCRMRLIIQTNGLEPSGAVWTDGASNLSRLDPSGAVQIDAEHPSRNRKVVSSNPTLGFPRLADR
jgi:hypothetical protein